MLKHVVFWRVVEEHNGLYKEEILNKMKGMLLDLPEKIAEIISFEVGLNVVHSTRAYDICLVSSFNSIEDLSVYAEHPDHLVVVDYFKQVVKESAAVDFMC